MPKPVVVTIPHQLGREEARRRLQDGMGQVRSQLSGVGATVEDHWSDNQMAFDVAVLAQTISGRVDVMDDMVRLEVDLPWVLAMIAEKITGRIAKQGTLLLTKS
ncbi:polyhydroxyalkanoic acid synthase [Skermanella stibiiresistens SB22]|uniref:Polyhydroxyalkanoic acid synthase n=1 Tax=Skermanella stibiiresistens SB22 TaxID=1385369 RepID=W9H6M2_9PROT|nr:polyhydroxyalkanoic acid system family protein [Skermanella stibiiresistens]EWY40441.1 polyhydroxyalkanoic acid synthase [Skermanella stibiiresistens SB22]